MRSLLLTQVCLVLVTLAMIILIIFVIRTLRTLDDTLTTMENAIKDLQRQRRIH